MDRTSAQLAVIYTARVVTTLFLMALFFIVDEQSLHAITEAHVDTNFVEYIRSFTINLRTLLVVPLAMVVAYTVAFYLDGLFHIRAPKTSVSRTAHSSPPDPITCVIPVTLLGSDECRSWTHNAQRKQRFAMALVTSYMIVLILGTVILSVVMAHQFEHNERYRQVWEFATSIFIYICMHLVLLPLAMSLVTYALIHSVSQKNPALLTRITSLLSLDMQAIPDRDVARHQRATLSRMLIPSTPNESSDVVSSQSDAQPGSLAFAPSTTHQVPPHSHLDACMRASA